MTVRTSVEAPTHGADAAIADGLALDGHGDPAATGEGRQAGALVRVFTLTDGRVVQTRGVDAVERALSGGEGCVWVDVTDGTPDLVAAVTRSLRLHPLIVEDIVEGNQRAKLEVTEDVVHLVIFALGGAWNDVELGEIDIILRRGALLTVHDAAWDPRSIHRVRDPSGELLARGADHLLWAIVDSVVDGYFPFLDRIGDAIDELEDRVMAEPTPATLQELFELKRDLIRIRRAVGPTRDVFNQLTNRDLALIDPEEMLYFRDVYDHVIRLSDELDTYREMVAGALDVYLSTVNNNLSLIMKRLTGITVILAGIGAIAGIFGMSEAGSAFSGAEAGGFWIVTALTVGIAFGLFVLLRRVNWI